MKVKTVMIKKFSSGICVLLILSRNLLRAKNNAIFKEKKQTALEMVEYSSNFLGQCIYVHSVRLRMLYEKY
jgi:hypothetical protein